MYPDGVAGGMHALAAGTAGSQYNNFTGRKARSTRELSGFRGYFCSIVNANSSLADFYLSTGGETSLSKTFGSGNNSNNTSYINSLRTLDQDGPVITLRGSSLASVIRGATYSDAGAYAFDAGDNASKTVSTPGVVDTSVAGAYTLTYTATDSKGNVGTTTRTLNVLDGLTSWAQLYNLVGIQAAAGADPDGDGWSNAQEYAFGLDPTIAGGSLFAFSQETNQVKLIRP
jgi:hypothetical protein